MIEKRRLKYSLILVDFFVNFSKNQVVLVFVGNYLNFEIIKVYYRNLIGYDYVYSGLLGICAELWIRGMGVKNATALCCACTCFN